MELVNLSSLRDSAGSACGDSDLFYKNIWFLEFTKRLLFFGFVSHVSFFGITTGLDFMGEFRETKRRD